MRPVGRQIRAILEQSDKLGRPAPAEELARLAGLVMSSSCCTRTCRRAESYGLLDVVEVTCAYKLRFMARPGWFAAVTNPRTFKNPRIKATPKPETYEAPSKVVNSVWSLGA